MCGLAADARADKKKAGLFDIDWWKPPVRHEHNAAQTLAPKGLNLAPGGAAQGEARAIRLRVYAMPVERMLAAMRKYGRLK